MADGDPSTPRPFEPVVRPGADRAGRALRRRRVLYGATSATLAAVLGLAVLDGVDVLDAYGVDDAHAIAEADGWELDVRYGTVSRPALATPFELTVRRDGGFDGPIEVAVDAAYLAMWDENGLDPQPSAETADDRWLRWTFDPPPGDTLVISFDGRIEPAAQRGARGRAAIVVDGSPVVEVGFRTRVLP